ncbi:MAG: hypothetical protein CMJ80_11555 [Planctomycetaceae bacterium]|nr:hypothetical protein [Planctomycetaceae bacterium]
MTTACVAILAVSACSVLLNLEESSQHLMRALSLVCLASSSYVISHALLQREHRFLEITIADSCSYFISYVVVGIGLAVLGAGAWSLVASILTHAFLRATLLWSRTRHSLLPRFSRTASGPLMRFGSTITAARIVNYGAQCSDGLITGFFLGNYSLGIYSRSMQLIKLPFQLIVTSVHSVLFPLLARVEEVATIRKTYYRATMFLLCLMTSYGCVLFLIAPELIEILFGPAWKDSAPLLRILAPISVFSVYSLGDAVLKATNHVRLQVYTHTCFFLSLSVSSLIGAIWLGVNGVATAVLLSYILVYLGILAACRYSLMGTWYEVWQIHVPPLCMGAVIIGSGAAVRTTFVSIFDAQGPMLCLAVTATCTMVFLLVSTVPTVRVLAEYRHLFLQNVGVVTERLRTTTIQMRNSIFETEDSQV